MTETSDVHAGARGLARHLAAGRLVVELDDGPAGGAPAEQIGCLLVLGMARVPRRLAERVVEDGASFVLATIDGSWQAWGPRAAKSVLASMARRHEGRRQAAAAVVRTHVNLESVQRLLVRQGTQRDMAAHTVARARLGELGLVEFTSPAAYGRLLLETIADGPRE